MDLRPIYLTAALRTLESAWKGEPLMERAGAAAAARALALLGSPDKRVLVLAGPGNNGGDGFVVARELAAAGCELEVLFAADPARLPADAAAARERWLAGGGTTRTDLPPEPHFALVVDALFGIGMTRPIEGHYASWVERVNAWSRPVLALDVPSGLDADTGFAHGPVVRASATSTFIGLKPGLVTGDGLDLAGAIEVHDLGVSPAEPPEGTGYLLEWPALRKRVPPRLRNTHKGTYGTLGIVGGAEGMVGAALLAGRAALYAGTGKVNVGFAHTPPPPVDWIQPELMLRPATSVLGMPLDVLVVGPGLAQSQEAVRLLGTALGEDLPLVLDADALNLVATHPALGEKVPSRHAPTLLTPHPTEAARLLRSTTAEIQADRLGAALALARRFHAHVVLKGAGSVCATPEERWYVNASGNPGLATGGSGDVLSGLIGALLAQGQSAEDALLLGVCLHGAAADALSAEGEGPSGITASELAPAARRLLNA